MEKRSKGGIIFYCFLTQGGDRMGESRQNPEQLPKSIQTDEENRNKGHLKIFSDMQLVWVKPTPC